METRVSLTPPPADLTVVTELVALLLALMRADQELQAVFLKELLRHIRPKVAATTSHLVFSAALLRHGVAPEDI